MTALDYVWNPEEHPRDPATGQFISWYEYEERQAAEDAVEREQIAKDRAEGRSGQWSRPADVDVPAFPEWWNQTEHYYIQDGVPEIPTPLFHGTWKEEGFRPGDVIKPVTKSYAHAARCLGTARVFGKAHVYLVEPVNGWTDKVWQSKMKYTQGEHHTEHLDKGGFRVIREVMPHEHDTDFDAERKRRRESWQALYNVSWCKDCTQYHKPGNHRK